jgi:hypothetical protein
MLPLKKLVILRWVCEGYPFQSAKLLADGRKNTIRKLQRFIADKRNYMLERFVNMVNRLSKGAVPIDAKKSQLSDQEIIKSASQCMWQGLPDSFLVLGLSTRK